MPTPREDESRSEFIDRCIPIVLDEGTADDGEQARAICESYWDEDKKMMHKHLDVGLHVKEVTEEGVFSGYGSVFGNEDGMQEIVEKGAFESSLQRHAQNGTMPAMLWQHDFRQVIGKYLDIKEDDRGLYVKGQLAKTPRGKEALELLRMEALSGMSIGYMPQKYEIDEETDVLTHKEVDLWEVSLVTFPANQEARVSEVKAALGNGELPTKTKLEALLRNAGFSRRQAKGLLARGYEGLRQRDDADGEVKAADQFLNLLKR
jgi:HK97 family phage prohead protease